MRIAVLSDIHGNLAALVAVLEDMQRQPPEAIINLGDCLSAPFDPLGVADLLIDLKLPTVRGNHDRWILEAPERDWPIDALIRDKLGARRAEWLASLPATNVLEDTVFMCHGTPDSDETAWMDEVQRPGQPVTHRPQSFVETKGAGVAYPVMVCGHSHIARSLRMDDGRLLVNPGSVGWQFGFGSPDAHYAIIEKRRAGWAAELRAVPYNSSGMQKLAIDAGYPKFAEMLRTGWPNPFSD